MANCRKVMIACVQSIVLYGSELWWDKQKGRERELQKIQNRMGRCITGAWRTTPVEAIAKEVNLLVAGPTLNNRQRRAAERTAVLPDTHPMRRIVADWQSLQEERREEEEEYKEGYREKRRGLGRRYRERLEEAGVRGEKERQTLRETKPNRHKTTIMNISKKTDKEAKEAKRMIEEYLQDKYSDQEAIQIFTDGTRQEDGTVAAAYGQTHPTGKERRYYLGKNKEVFDTKCWAIKERAESLARDGTYDKKIMFGVDSQAAIFRMQTRIPRPAQLSVVVFRKVVETLQLRGCKVEILWTPSHIGIEGNERADMAAEQAARRATRTRERPKWMSISHIRRRVNSLKKREGKQALESSNIGTEYVSSGDKGIKTFKKSETARLIQLRTNHFLSTSYKKGRGNQMEDTCTLCNREAMTRDHLMTRCKTLRGENLDLIRECKLDKFKMTGYGLTEEKRRRREDPVFWKLYWVRMTSNDILEKATPEMIINWQKETGVGYRLFPRSREREG